jgi:hypothetical protein
VASIASAPAQFVFVGPSAPHADIQSAIDAASPGSRIVVAPGSYPGFVLDKPLSIIGEGGGVILTSANSENELLTVRNLPAGSDTVIRSVSFFNLLSLPVRFHDCEGRILVDTLVELGVADHTVSNCAQVMLNSARLSGSLLVDGSNVTLVDSTVSGSAAAPTEPPKAGVDVSNGQVVAARTSITGGGASLFSSADPGAGVLLRNGGRLVATGDTSFIGAGQGFTSVGSVSAIEGVGEVLLDPDVPLSAWGSAPGVASSVTATYVELPALSAIGGILGGMSTVRLFGDPGDSFVMLVGQPGSPIPIPAFQGSIQLNPLALFVIASGMLDANGQAMLSFPVLENRIVLGVQVHWVALTFGANPPTLSNNAGYTHGV